MKKLDSNGFSVPELLVSIVIIGLIVTVGWLVYERQHKKSAPVTVKTTTTPAASTPPAKDETADWTEAKSGLGAYSVKMPGAWVFDRYMGSNQLRSSSLSYDMSKKVTVVNREGVYAGDTRVALHISVLDQKLYTKPASATSADFTAGSLKGAKYEKTFVVPANTISDVKNGDKAYEYYLPLGNGKAIVATYFVAAGDTDQVSLVDKAIGTLKAL